MQISEKLLILLACPECKSDLKQEGEKLVCDKCASEYPLKQVAGPDGKGMLMPNFLDNGND